MGDRVRGKAIIVTGAGSIGPGMGNGKASSILYAREGGRVLLVDQNLEAAKETCRLIETEGGTGIPFACDVTSSAECQKWSRPASPPSAGWMCSTTTWGSPFQEGRWNWQKNSGTGS